MTSKEHNLPAGVTEEPISSKPLNIANIHNMRINANVTEGYYSITLKNMTDSEQRVRIHVVKVS